MAEADDTRLEAVRQITSSNSFAKAPRLCSFLSYIVEKSIEGDVDSLTEQQIGIHVFNRSPGYNSNDDNIVRGTARALRQRLANYYLAEGISDSVRIEIPKGAYVARFHDIVIAPEMLSSEDVHLLPGPAPGVPGPPTSRASKGRSVWAGWIVASLVALAAIWPMAHSRWVLSHDKSNLLWSSLFMHDRPTYIVTGDAGLNMFEVLEERTVDLTAYTQQTYRLDSKSPNDIGTVLGSRYYTTVPDMQLVAKLMRLPQVDVNQTHVRFARDLAVSDIKDANLILMGTRSYNPWTDLFQSGLTLPMSWDVHQDMFTVTNRTPQPGEQAVYHWTVKSGTQGGLTLIALTDNSQGIGRVLLVEGTTMAGVYAGSDFLSNKQLLEPILSKARRPDGSLRNFDVLLQSDFIRQGVSNLHVLAVHVH